MNIEEFADVIGVDIIIRRFSGQNNRYMADLEHTEVMEDGGLLGESGNADSPAEAVNDYAQRIRGKRIAVDAFTEERRNFGVPDTLTGIDP